MTNEFKIWDKKLKKWCEKEVKLYLAPTGKLVMPLSDCMLLDAETNERFEVVPSIDMKDDKDIAIYYGDIVYCWGGEYWQGYWEFEKTIVVEDIHNLDAYLTHCEHIEVIGNKFEKGIKDTPEEI